MPDLVPAAFEHLHNALGNPPFPWQARLLNMLLHGTLPTALDLPTGLGKTSIMAIWLVARACGASHLPRRLVYVVDRRAVVDQATAEAEQLRSWCNDPSVAKALGLGDRPLAISTLRGQFVDNRAWLEDPSRPAIVVGTVDMIGSRLLFEGYACSRKMRPYHAGMLGHDTLLTLDEAHLVPPFERLVRRVAAHDTLRPATVAPPLQVLSLSATGRRTDAAPFRLDDADHQNPIVRTRVEAPKRARVETLTRDAKLADTLAARAWALAEAAKSPVRILVFCDKRDDAEKAQQALERLAKKARGKTALPETELFVGGRRVRERTHAAQRLRTLGFIAGAEPPVDHAFVFATSAGEVGVDMDADHAVSDVVAWERMVQRLGRVNRRGDGEADVVLVADPSHDFADPVVGLLDQLPETPDRRCDVGLRALADLRDAAPDAVEAASTPEPLYPPLSGAVVEAWAMTSLETHTGRPEVRPWLRGWIVEEPQTSVVWRSQLPHRDAKDRTWREFFEAAPPHTSERLDTESYRVVAWCAERARAVADAWEDDVVVAWVLDPAGTFERALTLGDLAAAQHKASQERLKSELQHRILVVDAALGGLSPNGLLDPAASTPPPTGEVDALDWLPRDARDPPSVPFRVRTSTDAEPVREAGWRERLRLPLSLDEDETVTRWLVVEKWRHISETEDDRSSGPPQLLVEHQAWAEAQARRLAEALELPTHLTEALTLAARLHDEGKQAARWQRAFHAPENGVYAKTRGPVNVRLLDGYRHELGSLPHVANDPAFNALAPDLQDLVLHLVVAHHGFGRPVIRTRSCDDAPPSRIEARARDVALRFVRLQRTWGPWGLAWLETLLRAADQLASRANDEREAP